MISIQRMGKEHEIPFLEAVNRSRRLHGDWVSPPSTSEAFISHLDAQDGDRGICYAVLLDDSEIVGCLNLNEIVRGVFLSAYLGFYVFEPYDGKGLMRQALSLVVAEAFDALGLHRLEANIQPSNEQSITLVKSVGFRLEGFSPRYLRIAGRWRDHERYALTAEDTRNAT